MFRLHGCRSVLACALLATLTPVFLPAQAAEPTAKADPSASARKSVELAKSGHCKDALPLLKKSAGRVLDKDLKHDLGFAGVRCAMFADQPLLDVAPDIENQAASDKAGRLTSKFRLNFRDFLFKQLGKDQAFRRIR